MQLTHGKSDEKLQSLRKLCIQLVGKSHIQVGIIRAELHLHGHETIWNMAVCRDTVQ